MTTFYESQFSRKYKGVSSNTGFFKVEPGQEGYYYLGCTFPNWLGFGGMHVNMHMPYIAGSTKKNS